MMWKIAYFVGPLIGMIAGNVAIYSLAIGSIENRLLKIAVAVSFTLMLFFGLLKLVVWLATKAKIDLPQLGPHKKIWLGVCLGIAISSVSAFAFAKLNDRRIDWPVFAAELPYSSLAAIAPATVEEATFRFGIVHGATALAGPIFGCAAGSIPFGLGHLIDRLTGKTVSMEQAYGIVLAGLLLSLLYLEFGLWSAIGCHWAWNALAGPWVKAMHLETSIGMSDFEGAVSTSVVLAILVAVILSRRLPLRKLQFS